uniref:Uncharacterized protein n=1 Tax=Arundo donax TaxID=35708 RepID=A0A0A9B4U4_ARUDO
MSTLKSAILMNG